MAIIKDIYDLKYSNPFTNEGMQETQQDLILDTSVHGGSSVSGTVTNTSGDPIQNVTVKLFDSNGNPFNHTMTDENGTYSFTGLQAGNYSISAVKEGYIITVPSAFYLQEQESKAHSFTLTEENSLDLCSIAGHIYSVDDEEKKMIEDAEVYLLNATTLETIMTTTSVEDGEYLFYGITAGNYVVKVTKQGYSPSGNIAVTAINHTIINTDIQLTLDPEQNVGTISGYVKHNGQVISNAFVGLYSITEENQTERLIAITKTNTKGLYMFGNVESGKYKVKAKMSDNS